ncbi:DUF4209 domain-containing protein [Vibrio sp. CB1-14]|uniref:DUF4209 domain-containing protein n=1 Tax=Vibrio chaetopteri TaxID=3016528 RepID=A0AAU8BQN4_9VIBR
MRLGKINSNVKARRDTKRRRAKKMLAWSKLKLNAFAVIHNPSVQYELKDFLNCRWSYDFCANSHHGFSSVASSLEKLSKQKLDNKLIVQSRILKLMAAAMGMKLEAESKNAPLKPYYVAVDGSGRTTSIEDFTEYELEFFEKVVEHGTEPWLQSRLAEILWFAKKPRKRQFAHAAISSYILIPAEPDFWHRDAKLCWERAARLSLQLRDEALVKHVKSKLFACLNREYPSHKFMKLWVADLMSRLHLDSDFIDEVADLLFDEGLALFEKNDFLSSESYFKLSSTKYEHCEREEDYLNSLVYIADCYEKEADSRITDSNMVANSFYESAVQAYRRIPKKLRSGHNVEERIEAIRKKMTISGKDSLEEMAVITSPGLDISDDVKRATEHVSKKAELSEAIVYFSGLARVSNYDKTLELTKQSMRDNPLGAMMGSTHMSQDGRVIAKTPPLTFDLGEDNPVNKAVLYREMQKIFDFETEFVVYATIKPALNIILLEHTVSKEFLIQLCQASPLISDERSRLMGLGLWLGFELEFGSAIHILSPQIEHIVRTLLKNAGVKTTNLDRDGIENENGLSTLIDLDQSRSILGQDLWLEIKLLFTSALGPNLRNEAAHGLLCDNSSSSSSSIYAWWLSLRLVVHSAMGYINFDLTSFENTEIREL